MVAGGVGVDYDGLAERYDERYGAHDYSGVERAVERLVSSGAHVLELGCGTGRWLHLVETRGGHPVGVDRSRRMLDVARRSGRATRLVLGSALNIPLADGAFDVVLVVNALHHFGDVEAFVSEARRVLRPGGRLLTIGLDPNAGSDEWYVYDHFPGTLDTDRDRYPAAGTIREAMTNAGFQAVESFVAQRWSDTVDASWLLDDPGRVRRSCSQLVLLDDRDYSAGVRAIREAASRAEARGEVLQLRGRLALHGTTGIRGGCPAAVDEARA